MATNCANHTCAKALALDRGDANVLCPLCASPDTVYCGEACRMMDWVTHKCPNALLVNATAGQKEVMLFTPYAFEDTLNAKELKQVGEALTEGEKLQLQSEKYLVQVQHPNQQVSQHLVTIGERAAFKYVSPILEEAFLEGMPAEDFMKDATVSAKVEYNGRTIELGGQRLEDRIIYEGHAPSDVKLDTMKRVRKQKDRSNEYVIFLRPKPGQPVVDFRLKDALRLETFVDGDKRVHSLDGQYVMSGFGMQVWNRLFRVAKDRFQALFPGTDIQSYMGLRGVARDNQSKFMLIFERAGQKKLSFGSNPEARMFLKGLIYTVPRNTLAAVSGRVTTGIEAGKPAPVPPKSVVVVVEPKMEEKAGAGAASFTPTTTIKFEDDGPLPERPTTPSEPESYTTPEERDIPPPPIFIPPPPPTQPQQQQPESESESESSPPPSPPPPRADPIVSKQESQGGLSPEALRRVQLRKRVVEKSSSKSDKTSSLTPGVQGAFAAIVARRGAIAKDEEIEVKTPAEEAEWKPAQIPFPVGVQYRCDASDLSQMVGLAMALDLRERDLPEHVSTAAALVRTHARALMEKRIEDPSNVPTDVSAAVYSAVQTLQELPVYQ